MKKTINITIPTDIMDITVQQYIKYYTLVQDMDMEQEINEFVRINILSIFCNVPTDFIREQMIYSEVIDISDKILKLLLLIDDKILKSVEPSSIIELDGTEFGFIPDFEQMKAGVYADLTTYVNEISNLHRVTAILYRPIKEKKYNKLLGIDQYDIVDYNGTSKYSNLMLSFPAVEALRAYFFLYSSSLILIDSSLQYMKK